MALIARRLLQSLPAALLVCSPIGAAAPDSVEHFETKVRPLLAKRCFACHTSTPMGGLVMNSRNSLLKGGATGPAIVPGKPEASLLIQAIEHLDPKMKMPMAQPKLPANEIAILTEWIKAGAFWPETEAPSVGKAGITDEQRSFWAFRPVVKVPVPRVKIASWAKTPIDHFVLSQLEAKNLRPNPPSDRRDLIRRAYLDLIGIPPTYEETLAFINDKSADAFSKVVDRLLASPRYGERWARYWLDVARYADDRLDSDVELPYPNSFRYRDWVIKAFNEDMPYDTFVKAQIAGDLMEGGKEKQLAVGLGFYGLSPELTDDRVDVTTRGFLALTGACAQCHDHKFDPIPTKDYYAIQGIFSSTKRAEFDLDPPDVVEHFKTQQKRVNAVKSRIEQFLHLQATQLAEILASESPRYIRAVRKIVASPMLPAAKVAQDDNLDLVTLERWIQYLKTGPVENKYLHGWQDESFDLAKFRQEALAVLIERKQVDEKNAGIKRAPGDTDRPVPAALPADRFYLWRDLFFNDFYGNLFKQEEDGILYYGPNRGYLSSDGEVERYIEGHWKTYLAEMRAELKELETRLPPQYAFAHVIRDIDKPKNVRIQIGGQPENLGPEAPRAFLSILSKGEPVPFRNGSGRLELAEAIADPGNPLTARVMVNRIWQHHFGEGLVRTVSNFGQMGERPSHPELLDYLASTFVENEWSMKKLHRAIMLSATYQLSSNHSAEQYAVDPANRLLWRANRQRLDAESMRDTLLAVSGNLDLTMGGQPQRLDSKDNLRRSIYGYVSRRKLDGTMALFDFPNPNLTAEQRIITATPLQQLFFLNSDFLADRAKALVKRNANVISTEERIRQMYRHTLARDPLPEEIQAGKEFISTGKSQWLPYAQILLSSNELLFMN